MQDEILTLEDTVYPSIVFKLHGGLFAINSKYISTILQLPQHETLPDCPSHITGIFQYRNDVIQMIDLRRVFGMMTLEEESQEFTDMIEARKQDHIHWVKELERSVEENEPFTLATDPHKCAFGRWYDNVETQHNTLAFHLKKIDEPHKKLHQAALEVANCQQNCDVCQRSECLKSALDRARLEYMPRILTLLDETIDTFRNYVYHGMALVMTESARSALIVDEVLSVEVLTRSDEQEIMEQFYNSHYISGVVKSAKQPGLILELNGPKILELAGDTETAIQALA